jgi:ParB family transcriptional regulator, chromosome partitioning protein
MAFSLFNIGKSKEPVKNQVVEVPLAQIVPNRYQPRQVFDQTAIQELAQTIDEHGLLQPIILREYEDGKYEIIAGERRFRAMSLLKWEKAPAIVEKMSDQETASLALIENLQRSQLSPVEEAQAYQKLMELNKLTQSALAKGMGKSQSFVANKLRLLQLITPVQNAIMDHKISERHGRAMLGLTEDQQRETLMKVVNNDWTVRQTEDEVARLQGKPVPSKVEAQKQRELFGLDEELTVKKGSAPTKKGKKATKKVASRVKVSDPRIAVNTIKKSLKLVNDNGFKTKVKETPTDNGVELTITIVAPAD